MEGLCMSCLGPQIWALEAFVGTMLSGAPAIAPRQLPMLQSGLGSGSGTEIKQVL